MRCRRDEVCAPVRPALPALPLAAVPVLPLLSERTAGRHVLTRASQLALWA
jgi:hypothetical protein